MKAEKHLPMYLDLKEAGESLVEVAVDVIKTDKQNVVSYWYHSELDVDVHVWCDERGNIIKQQVSICGQICEWNIVEGVRTGLVMENEDENSEDGISSIFFDKSIQMTSVKQALGVIEFAESISQTNKHVIISNFENSPRIDKIDPKEFVARYSPRGRKRKKKHFLANYFKKLFK